MLTFFSLIYRDSSISVLTHLYFVPPYNFKLFILLNFLDLIIN